MTFHKNAKEMNNYWHGEQVGKPPKLVLGTDTGFWRLKGHTLFLMNSKRRLIKKIKLTSPDKIDGLFYPNPNDMSGNSEVRHFWKCGKCGCKEIEELYNE